MRDGHFSDTFSTSLCKPLQSKAADTFRTLYSEKWHVTPGFCTNPFILANLRISILSDTL